MFHKGDYVSCNIHDMYDMKDRHDRQDRCDVQCTAKYYVRLRGAMESCINGRFRRHLEHLDVLSTRFDGEYRFSKRDYF